VNDAEQALIVQYLRGLDEKMDRILDDVREVKQTLSSIEASVARLDGDFTGGHSDSPHLILRRERSEPRRMAASTVRVATLRDAPLRGAPQGEGGLGSR
jgi:hypothetical protein